MILKDNRPKVIADLSCRQHIQRAVRDGSVWEGIPIRGVRGLAGRERGPLSKARAPVPGPPDPAHLAFGADLVLELADGSQHVEQKPPRLVRGVDVLALLRKPLSAVLVSEAAVDGSL